MLPPRFFRCGLWTALVLALVAASAARGADDGLSEGVRRNENGQQQIQTQAQELAARLRAMSAEFERNGLTGDEVKTLDGLSRSVGAMSDQEMARVVALLRQAQASGDARGALQQIAAAYVGQKEVTLRMKGLLARYQKDQAAADVAAALAKLAERQANNFQAGVDVAQWTQGKKPEETQAALRAALETQASEQAALRDEARLAAGRLLAAARDPADPAAARLQAALGRLNGLNAALDQAADDLKNGRLFKAVAGEKAARDALRQLARDLTPLKPDDADTLRQAGRQLDDMVAQQKTMIAQTQKIAQVPADLEHWLQQGLGDPGSAAHKYLESKKLLGKSLEELKDDKDAKGGFASQVTNPNNQTLAALEGKTNELADRGDAVSQDLQKPAAPVSAAVRAALEKIQSARANLDDRNAPAALQDQQAALAQMEQAQKQLQARIAEADAANNADRAAQLQALARGARELAAQQLAASQQQAAQPQAAANNAAQQAALQQKAQALQEQAARAQSPAAAASLQSAAGHMEQAAGDLNKPNGQAQAQAQENAAQADLQNAQAQADRDLAQAVAAQQELKQVDQLLASLEKIIVGQENVQAGTTFIVTRTAPKPDKTGRTPRAYTASELASQQSGLKANTAVLAQALAAPDLKSAVAPLTDAGGQMEASRGALLKSDAAVAVDPQRLALADLLRAKELLNARKNELDQQANASPQQQQQAAQAAADQLAQAQAQAQAAQQQLAQAQANNDPAQTRAAQQALDNAANAAGQANAATPGTAADPVKQALQEAQNALNQAANAANKGDAAQAQAQAQKAQQALAQAQTQAQAAQSGLAQASDPGAPLPPSGGPAPPGQPPGSPPGPASQPSQGEGTRDPNRAGQGAVAVGPRGTTKPPSAFTGLPARDRAALQQSQSEKYPQEYGPMIEQYMQNLADDSGG